MVSVAVRLQLEPLANTNVAAEPIKEMVAPPKLMTPVLATVKTVDVPPVVVIVFEFDPEKLIVPATAPVFPVPVNPKETGFEAWFRFNVLPLSMTKSSPVAPEIDIALNVEELACNETLVLLVTLNWPIVIFVASTLMTVDPPAVDPSPSIMRMSEFAADVLLVPLLFAAVFQLVDVLQFPPEVPTQ